MDLGKYLVRREVRSFSEVGSRRRVIIRGWDILEGINYMRVVEFEKQNSANVGCSG